MVACSIFPIIIDRHRCLKVQLVGGVSLQSPSVAAEPKRYLMVVKLTGDIQIKSYCVCAMPGLISLRHPTDPEQCALLQVCKAQTAPVGRVPPRMCFPVLR